MNDADFDFIVTEFFKRGLKRFNRALNVCLDKQIKFLHLAFAYLVEHVVKRYLLSLICLFVL